MDVYSITCPSHLLHEVRSRGAISIEHEVCTQQLSTNIHLKGRCDGREDERDVW